MIEKWYFNFFKPIIFSMIACCGVLHADIIDDTKELIAEFRVLELGSTLCQHAPTGVSRNEWTALITPQLHTYAAQAEYKFSSSEIEALGKLAMNPEKLAEHINKIVKKLSQHLSSRKFFTALTQENSDAFDILEEVVGLNGIIATHNEDKKTTHTWNYLALATDPWTAYIQIPSTFASFSPTSQKLAQTRGKANKPPLHCTPHGDQLISVGENKLASGKEESVIRIWPMDNGDWARQSPDELRVGIANPIHDMCLHPDNQHLYAIARDNTIRVWRRTAAGNWVGPVTEIQREEGTFLSQLIISPQGKYLAGNVNSMRNEIELWSLDTDGNISSTKPKKLTNGVFKPYTQKHICFNPTGSTLAVCCEATILVWSLKDGSLSSRQKPNTFRHPHGTTIDRIYISPNGRYLAGMCGFNRSICIWCLDDNGLWNDALFRNIIETDSIVFGGDFSPDSTQLAYTTEQGLHMLTQNMVQANPWKNAFSDTIPVKEGCRAASFTPDGTHLATIDDEGTIHLYHTETQNFTPGQAIFIKFAQQCMLNNTNFPQQLNAIWSTFAREIQQKLKAVYPTVLENFVVQ